MSRPVMCFVTDRTRYPSEDALVAAISQAARAGVHLIQVRERDLEGGPLRSLVMRCVDAVRGTCARVIVNDRADVALAAGAHGVHLPANGIDARRLRPAVPAGFIIGRSVHDSTETERVCAEGALDYVIFGTVFPSASKPGLATGVPVLRAIVSRVAIPVLAIGGVTPERVADVAAAGAAGFAAIGLFADAASKGMDTLHAVVQRAALAFDTPQRVP